MLELKHAYIIIYRTQRKQHTFIQAFNMFIMIINNKQDCKSKIDKITDLIKNSFCNQLRHCNVPPNHRPACSSISEQHCHPQAGHDSPRNKELTILHIAKGTQFSQANTVGFIKRTTDYPSQQSWVYQAIQELGKANAKLVHRHQNHSGFQNTHTHPTQGNQSLLCNVVPQTLISTVMSPTLRLMKRTLLYIESFRHLDP